MTATSCGSGAVAPLLLQQSSTLLQACFLISTADEFSNPIAESLGSPNITAAVAEGFGVEIFQEQGPGGESWISS